MRWDPISRQFRVYHKGGSSTPATTTVNQLYSPEEAAMRTDVMGDASQLYNKLKGKIKKFAPVGPSQATQDAQGQLLDWAGGQGQQLADTTSGYSNWLMGDARKAESNPYLQSHIDAAIRPITQSYTDPGGVFSSIRTSSIADGPSSRQGIAEGIMGGRYMQTIGDVSSRMAGENYQNALRAGTQALALAPQTAQVGQAPALATGAVGTQQEAYDAEQRAWKMNAPWLNLQNYANIVFGGANPGTTTTSTGTTPAGPSTANKALSGAATGAMMGSMVGMPMVGAGVGLLAGLFA
jgi:hypothetical protein